MAINRARCNVGMRVVGSDGAEVGTVKECRTNDFLVDRRMQRDIFVPYDAVQDITGDQITLNIPAHQVDNMGWPTPPVVGGAPGATPPRGS